jgi:hypothetical protein
MATIEHCRRAIQEILCDYARIPYAHGEIEAETVFDRESDRYLLMVLGWDGMKRIHGCLAHLDINDGKIWIQRDGTETGIANELVRKGIPKDQIVLAFHSSELRRYTEFAFA